MPVVVLKQIVKKLPIAKTFAQMAHKLLKMDKISKYSFPGSAEYWENRYASGGNSGVGSYGYFAQFKADVLNEFISQNDVKTVIEFGCGDGNQITLTRYPCYVGIDVSKTSIDKCRKIFRKDLTKSFLTLDKYNGKCAELSLSLDVIYHLTEDDIFDSYMRRLFDSSTRFVIIYSSNMDQKNERNCIHVRHRKFTNWIEEYVNNWRLIKHIPNKYPYAGDFTKGSFSDFYFYQKLS